MERIDPILENFNREYVQGPDEGHHDTASYAYSHDGDPLLDDIAEYVPAYMYDIWRRRDIDHSLKARRERYDVRYGLRPITSVEELYVEHARERGEYIRNLGPVMLEQVDLIVDELTASYETPEEYLNRFVELSDDLNFAYTVARAGTYKTPRGYGPRIAESVYEFLTSLNEDDIPFASRTIRKYFRATSPDEDMLFYERGIQRQGGRDQITFASVRGPFTNRMKQLCNRAEETGEISVEKLNAIREHLTDDSLQGVPLMMSELAPTDILSNPEQAEEIRAVLGGGLDDLFEHYDLTPHMRADRKRIASSFNNIGTELFLDTLDDSSASGSENAAKLRQHFHDHARQTTATDYIRIANSLFRDKEPLPIDLRYIPTAISRLIEAADFHEQDDEAIERRQVAGEIAGKLIYFSTQLSTTKFKDPVPTEHRRVASTSKGRKRIVWNARKSGYGVVS